MSAMSAPGTVSVGMCVDAHSVWARAALLRGAPDVIDFLEVRMTEAADALRDLVEGRPFGRVVLTV